MKAIQLTRGYTAYVSDQDYRRCMNEGKWQALVTQSGKVYAIHGVGVLLHRFIKGARCGQQVDHKNGDGLKCTRRNMRLANASQNQFNRGKAKRNKSGFKGVSWDRRDKKWKAYIRIGKRKQLYLGSFDRPQEAGKTYAKASKLHHGRFSKL